MSGPIHASARDMVETITFRHFGNQGESVVDRHPVRLPRVCRWGRGPDFRYSWREGEGLFYERIGRRRTGTHGDFPFVHIQLIILASDAKTIHGLSARFISLLECD